jgi:CHASE2 domain-containing sensor protein
MLAALEAVIALNAIGGGIYGLAGAKNVPRAWLAGSPFHSYLIPSLVLLFVVGGGMIVALGLTAVGARRAAEVSIAAGLVLLGWITVEALIIPFSWLQPTFFVLAIAVVKLAYLERLQIAGRSRRGAHKGER